MSNVDEIGIRALTQNAPAVVAQVAISETINTNRRNPVVLPSPLPKTTTQGLRDHGRLRQATHRLQDLAPPTELHPLTEALLESRESERY